MKETLQITRDKIAVDGADKYIISRGLKISIDTEYEVFGPLALEINSVDGKTTSYLGLTKSEAISLKQFLEMALREI